MKIQMIVGATLLLISNVSCQKGNFTSATVVRDCSGTYLQIEGKDYSVCNLEKVANYKNEAKVKVTFDKLKECNGSAKDAIVCYMYHQNEGWISVNTIE
jgi:hypothetical protein